MRNEYTENLQSYNVTDGVSNTFNLPVIKEECKEILLKELPSETSTDVVTDAMLLAACGWKLNLTPKDKSTVGFLFEKSETPKKFASETFRLSCKYCNRHLPFKQYCVKAHNQIIPDDYSSLRALSKLRISERPVPTISPFSIDSSPPSFASNDSYSSFSFWDPDEASFTRKRKLSDDSAENFGKNKRIKKINQDGKITVENQPTKLQISTDLRTSSSNPRKRQRSDDDSEFDENENYLQLGVPKRRRKDSPNLSKVLQLSIIETNSTTVRSGEKRRLAEGDLSPRLTNKRRRTNSGTQCYPKALDPIREHRVNCPFQQHFYYPTGSGEVPGWIHSIRCMQLDPCILRAMISD